MNTAILVIDMPEDCRNCPLCGEDHITYRDYCHATNDYIFTMEKPDWCPLKELPNEVTPGSKCVEVETYCDGWNDFRDKILNTQEVNYDFM